MTNIIVLGVHVNYLYCIAILVLAVPLYIFSGLVLLIVRQARSPLRHIAGPSAPSWFLGNLGQMHDAENNNLIESWVDQHGSSFVYKGFCGGSRLMTTDTRALTHILTRAHNYPKPVFVRASLATMGGEDGLVVVEGEQHRRQRRILNQAFTPAQLRDVLPIFYDKAEQLRDIFLQQSPEPKTPTTPGAVPIPPPRIDVLSWLGRATLDAIGDAGFGYAFDSLTNPDNELAQAFATIFSAARKFRAMVILQAWFPWLKKLTESRSKEIAVASETTRNIGTQLVDAALSRSGKDESRDVKVDGGMTATDHMPAPHDGKDILSILVRSNMAEFDSKNMSHEEILCQISTFMAAGHETTSSALSWMLFQLSQSPPVQATLRKEVLTVSSHQPSMGELNALPYLDSVLRECLRLHAPVTSTMRSVDQDDIIPLNSPIKDRKGRELTEIRVRKGDIITIPIAPVNKLKSLWGPDAHEFKPERWKQLPDEVSSIPGIYSNMMTFLGGPRNCIGYRFALIEMKAFLFTLLRSCQFDIDPSLEIEKKLNIVSRPVVKSEPEAGNQMPLYVRPIDWSSIPSSSPTSPDASLPALSARQR